MQNHFPRAAGIFLHVTSLPGDFGIGDLGPSAYEFIDFLVRSGQKYWQILPLGPTGFGDSPYQAFSAFAGNTLLISPEKLVKDGFLSKLDLQSAPMFPNDKVDFGAVSKWKAELLSAAFETFSSGKDTAVIDEYDEFCRENQFWLDDYALFRAIKAEHDERSWNLWPEGLKSRNDTDLREIRERLISEVDAQRFFQFLFFRQWKAVKAYANRQGLKIIGDLPIFVALDSSDVWCNQDKFRLNGDGTASVVAGVPPDYYSKTGQLWGNPIYDWEALRSDGFRWWVARVYSTLQLVDIVRLDHFRGFVAAWEVPGEDETAENGAWVEVPGKELFTTLTRSLGRLPMIAEDLGFITPDVGELRDAFGIPGMRILQFGFGGDAANQDLPHNYTRHSVAYTGTHDNDTAIGWFRSLDISADGDDDTDAERIREHCLQYLGSDAADVNWNFIRAVWASVADTAIAPMADVLGLGSEGRMNFPSVISDNWKWRMSAQALNNELSDKLREMTETYGRSA